VQPIVSYFEKATGQYDIVVTPYNTSSDMAFKYVTVIKKEKLEILRGCGGRGGGGADASGCTTSESGVDSYQEEKKICSLTSDINYQAAVEQEKDKEPFERCVAITDVKLKNTETSLRLVNVHLGLSRACRMASAMILSNIVQTNPCDGCIMAGDFNSIVDLDGRRQLELLKTMLEKEGGELLVSPPVTFVPLPYDLCGRDSAFRNEAMVFENEIQKANMDCNSKREAYENWFQNTQKEMLETITIPLQEINTPYETIVPELVSSQATLERVDAMREWMLSNNNMMQKVRNLRERVNEEYLQVCIKPKYS
jgi:hypothetical protein